MSMSDTNSEDPAACDPDFLAQSRARATFMINEGISRSARLRAQFHDSYCPLIRDSNAHGEPPRLYAPEILQIIRTEPNPMTRLQVFQARLESFQGIASETDERLDLFCEYAVAVDEQRRVLVDAGLLILSNPASARNSPTGGSTARNDAGARNWLPNPFAPQDSPRRTSADTAAGGGSAQASSSPKPSSSAQATSSPKSGNSPNSGNSPKSSASHKSGTFPKSGTSHKSGTSPKSGYSPKSQASSSHSSSSSQGDPTNHPRLKKAGESEDSQASSGSTGFTSALRANAPPYVGPRFVSPTESAAAAAATADAVNASITAAAVAGAVAGAAAGAAVRLRPTDQPAPTSRPRTAATRGAGRRPPRSGPSGS
jgi:hypothetical protein